MFAPAIAFTLASLAAQPAWWTTEGGTAEDWAEASEIARAIGLEPQAMFTSEGDLTADAYRRLEALPAEERERLGVAGDPVAAALDSRAEYLANVKAMNQAPRPEILAIYDEAIRRAGGSVPVGDAVAAPTATTDRAKVGASSTEEGDLAEIAGTLPKERRPVAVYMMGSLGYGLYGTTTYDLSAGYLFPTGYLIDEECIAYDPMRAEATPQGAAAAGLDDCEMTKARRAGTAYEMWDEGEWWEPPGTSVITDRQAAPGERLSLALMNEDGFSDPTGSFYSASGTSEGRLMLTADGRIETNYTARMDTPGAFVSGPAITLGTRTRITTDTPVAGRYYLDGNVITIALDGGGVIQQLFTLTRDADTNEVDGAFFGGAFYWIAED